MVSGNQSDPNAAAITNAVAFLSKDIARSNDPDAARALLIASGKGYDVGTALDRILPVLKDPAQWPKDARAHYAVALAAAERYGKAAMTDLEAAAKLLVTEQHPDGSYGSMLDSWLARVALIAAGLQPDNFTVVQIDKFVRGATVESLSDALSAALALEWASDVMAEGLRRTSLTVIRDHQRANGSFGEEGGPAIYTTALAVLALTALDSEPRMARSSYRPEELKDAIASGKKYLVAQQRPDGGWTESTPWALLALLGGS